MAATFTVTVVSADRQLFQGEVSMIAATALQGELGILAGHTPMLAALKAGQVRLTLADGQEEIIYVSSGVLEVQPKQTIILADAAERADALSREKIEAAKARAQSVMQTGKVGSIDYMQAQNELIQAAAQMAALRRLRK